MGVFKDLGPDEPSAATDLQPHVLGGGGDGRDLEGRLAVLGDQLAGVDVVFGGQFGLDAHLHPVGGAPVGVGDLDLKRLGGEEGAVDAEARAGGGRAMSPMMPHLPLVGQPGLEVLARVLGVLDVDELLVDGRGVVEGGLPAPVHAGDRRPDAHRAPEVVRHVRRHHVSDAEAEVGRTFDLRRRRRRKKM